MLGESFCPGLGVTLKGPSDTRHLRLDYRGEWTGREDRHSVKAGFSIQFKDHLPGSPR